MILRITFPRTFLILFCLCSFTAESAVSGFVSLPQPATADSADSTRLKKHSGPLFFLNRLYKSLIADQLSSSCEFDPSCSVFSRQALSHYGPVKGFFLSTDRLTRCHGNAHGEVPAFFTNPLTAKLLDSIHCYDVHYLEQYEHLAEAGVCKLPYRSAGLAVLLSALIPGTGKYYLGYPYQATSSLITNLLLGGAAAEMLLLQPHSLLPVFGSAVFTAFYGGNIWGTALLAKKRKYDHCFMRLKPAGRLSGQGSAITVASPAEPAVPGPEQSAAACFQNADYNGTYAALLKLPDSVIRNSVSLLRIRHLTLIALGRFEESKAAMLADAGKDSALALRVNALPTTYRQLSPAKAFRLGGYFPGLGQAFAGYPGKALISLLLQAGCAGICYLSYREGMYLSGTIYGFYPLIRFYRGGKINGQTLAEKKNRKREEALAEQYRKVLEEILQY